MFTRMLLPPLQNVGERRKPISSQRLRLVALATVIALMASGIAGWPAPLATLLIVAPALEEIVFRRGLQEQLLRASLHPLAANLLTAAAFALMHGLTRSWQLALMVFGPACVLGWLYQLRRDLVPCIAVHAGMNLFFYTVVTVNP